jgi:hypothetical protein
VVRASGNEVFALGDKTGTRHCLVAVTGTGGEERGVPVQMTVPPPTWPLATLPQPPSKRTQVPMAPAGLAPPPGGSRNTEGSGNGGNWSIETLLRFLLFGEAGVAALAQTRRVHFVMLITRRKQ